MKIKSTMMKICMISAKLISFRFETISYVCTCFPFSVFFFYSSEPLRRFRNDCSLILRSRKYAVASFHPAGGALTSGNFLDFPQFRQKSVNFPNKNNRLNIWANIQSEFSEILHINPKKTPVRKTANVESGAVQKHVNISDLEECCKIRFWLPKSASIQPGADLQSLCNQPTPDQI